MSRFIHDWVNFSEVKLETKLGFEGIDYLRNVDLFDVNGFDQGINIFIFE